MGNCRSAALRRHESPAAYVTPRLAHTAQNGPTLLQVLAAAKRRKDFSFAGHRCLAKVVDVYDGDTIRVVFEYRGELIQYAVRMLGYDSPEMRPPKASPTRDAEKAAARASAAALTEKIGDAIVHLECGAFDKYGRLLATVFTRARDGSRGEDVNAWMLANRYGVPYGGGAKALYPGTVVSEL